MISVSEVLVDPVKNIPTLIVELEKKDESSDGLLKDVISHKSKLFDIAIQYWQQFYRLAFCLLNKGSCYAQYRAKKADQQRERFSFDLLERLRSIDIHQEVFDKILDLPKVFQQPQCQFIILEELLYRAQLAHGIDYSAFLPQILRTLSVILHEYLNIKKAKASSDKDKLELQITLEQNCQQWTKDFLIKATHMIARQISHQASARRYFLNFCADAVEALLHNMLEGTFRKDVLEQILGTISEQVLQNYSSIQITQIQSGLLKKHKYHHQKQNLEVPEKYGPHMLINMSGISYLINKFVQQKSFLWIYTDETILKIIIPSLSESFQKAFPHRLQILEKMAEYLKQPGHNLIKYDSINQYEYPLSNLLDSLISEDLSGVDSERAKLVIKAIKPSAGLFQKMLEFSQSTKVYNYIVEYLLTIEDFAKWKKVLLKLKVKAPPLNGLEGKKVQQLFEKVKAIIDEDWAIQLLKTEKNDS